MGVSGGGWGAETTLLLSCILCTDHTWKWSIKKKKKIFLESEFILHDLVTK